MFPHFMQLENQLGNGFQCTPAFWAKMSTIKLIRELNEFTSTDCDGMSMKNEVHCWIKERLPMGNDASNAIQEVVMQPREDKLQRANCTCSSF